MVWERERGAYINEEIVGEEERGKVRGQGIPLIHDTRQSHLPGFEGQESATS